ncbi:MAG: DUF2213 domain-containing protein [Synergistaceae bacterium]|nr:DUF2213 domain-containing protein [Synergistaceae bacterium]
MSSIFYAKERIGNTRYITPDGFLLCKDVPLARVGELEYLAQEAPEVTPVRGKVIMTRPESVLFSEDTVASFNGKPLLNGFHQQVTPDNYQDIAVGTVMNVHRGEGEAAGFLIGDLMIYDRNAIQSVQMGRTEISIGFESEYRETEAGRGEQSRIIGNHVALVDEGRAGPACAIGDEKPDKEAIDLEEKKEEVKTGDSVDVGALGKLVEMLKGLMAGGTPAPATDADPEPTSPAGGDDAIEARISKIEETLAEIMKHLPGGDEATETKAAPAEPAGDEETKAENGDGEEEVIVEDEMPPEEVVERAEILSPGIDVPEGDAKNAMPSLKLAALTNAVKTGGSAAVVIKSALGKHAKDIAKAPMSLVDTAFRVGSEMAREVNNASFSSSALVFGDGSMKDKKTEHPMSGSDLQKIYREAWAKENGGAK